MGNKHSDVEGASFFDSGGVQRLPVSSRSPNVTELGNILEKKALQEKNIKGIPDEIFAEYVFPSFYVHLGRRLFAYLKNKVESTAPFLSVKEFYTAIEHVLAMEVNEIDMYMNMYGEDGQITLEGFQNLLRDAYKIVEDHNYNSPVRCPHISSTIQSVVRGAFLMNKELSESQLKRWILKNCPRLTVEMHRYIIYTLKTATQKEDVTMSRFQANLPVIDADFSDENIPLPLSHIWLLAISLPELYILSSSNRDETQEASPSHWTQLYLSDFDGLGLNRFNHHVLEYSGPTVTIIQGENDIQLCIASATEWVESTETWGTEDCMVIEMFPKFKCMLRDKNNILYLNETFRRFPLGIRAGENPNKPVVFIDPDFTFVSYEFTRSGLLDMQVWGCGSDEAKEAQKDMKRRRMKDVEKARDVKLDPQGWIDHPDRFLLDLAGHPSYSAEAKTDASESDGKK